jgi:hypothetical protein
MNTLMLPESGRKYCITYWSCCPFEKKKICFYITIEPAGACNAAVIFLFKRGIRNMMNNCAKFDFRLLQNACSEATGL